MYRVLDSEKTTKTIEALRRRIEERFPSSGLGKVCEELCKIAEETRARIDWISRPNHVLRITIIVVILMSLLVLGYTISLMEITLREFSFGEFVQVVEAGLNTVVLVGAALFFLVTVEIRVKRARVLAALHELRSIAHVIDMHQLTYDPSRLANRIVTPSSPKREMTAFELFRYLDYCSEMLSLTGKVAGLYAQSSRDAVVLSSVNELEILSTGLSRKIWQKIMLSRHFDESPDPDSTAAP